MSDEDIQLVKVFETSDPGLLAVIESIFNENNIDFLTKNENLQELFGGGRIGGMNYILGPVQVWVREEDESTAKEVLAKLKESGDVDSDDDDGVISDQ